MRLLRFDIDQFRSVLGQSIPAEGLVVLFGANSAGKTSVLEAVEQLITQAGSLRPDPGAQEEPFVLGSVLFSLPAADVPGSEDAGTYLSLVRGEHIKPGMLGQDPDYPWDWLDDECLSALKNLDLDQAKAMLAGALARTGHAGSAEDRAILARSVVEPAAAYFAAELTSVSLNASGQDLPAEARRAAIRIAREPGEDALSKIGRALASDGWAHVAWVASGGFAWGDFAASFPPVIILNGDIESLSAELESALVPIHDRLWGFELEVLDSPSGMGKVLRGEFTDIGSREQGLLYAADPWLETRADDGEALVPGLFASYDWGDWHRVRRSVLATAELIEREANRVAPDFVKSQGHIGIEVLPASVWGSGRPRVRGTFTENGGTRRGLNVVGAGTARWAAAAIRLAVRRLGKATRVVVDESGVIVEDEDRRRRIVAEALRNPRTQTQVGLEPSDAPGIYIVDEPEAHLHPAALRSVAIWLGQLARTEAIVMVATHSTALLDCKTEVVHRVLVQRDGERTQLREMTGSLADELGRVSDELGLTKGELLLLTRLTLFVEGVHDEIVLNEWFGDDLRTAGIRVYQVGGVTNLPGVASSEVIAALGIQVATLSDNTSVSRVLAGEPRTSEERVLARLMSAAKSAGVVVHSVGLDLPDILYYLDPAICRRHGSAFPGWQQAHDEAESSGVKDWKNWVRRLYQMPITESGIRDMARECRAQEKIPAEIAGKIHALIAYASAKG